jgi:hypothetical protein
MLKVDKAESSVLEKATIDDSGPGTILRDFDTLLDFLGEDVVVATRHNHFIPKARLPELDERMTNPLRPRLKRPLQKSYPHIHGMYLLGRAALLLRTIGSGNPKGKLLRDPEMYAQWRCLNPTERYFNLIEAWLRFACWSMVGQRVHFMENLIGDMQSLFNHVRGKGRLYHGDSHEDYFISSPTKQCTLALLELFGWVTVEREQPAEGRNWPIAAIRQTPFGRALVSMLVGLDRQALWNRIEERDDAEDDGIEDDDTQTAFSNFGEWQPALQPYFPEWRNNLSLPEPEFRDGVYYFKVSLGDVWRRIAINAADVFNDLAWAIIDAYEFDGDHLFGFEVKSAEGRLLRVEPAGEADLYSDEVLIGGLELEPGASINFEYDYGAGWKFKIKLEKIAPLDPSITEPTVVESHGEAPPEYDYSDW